MISYDEELDGKLFAHAGALAQVALQAEADIDRRVESFRQWRSEYDAAELQRPSSEIVDPILGYAVRRLAFAAMVAECSDRPSEAIMARRDRVIALISDRA